MDSKITGNAFRISLQSDWQIDSGFLNNRQHSNFVVSRLNKRAKKLVIHAEQEFSFSTLAAPFNYPNLFLLFLLILKCFQKF